MAKYVDIITDLLQESNPEVMVEPGTANYDILINPLATILQPLYDEIQTIKSWQSLTNYDNMPEEELDALVANYFVTRNEGSKAIGTVRVLFESPVAVTFSKFTRFYTRSNLGFVPRAVTTVSADTMSFSQQGSYYYVDLSVEAESEGTEYNILSNQIIGADSTPTNFVQVSNSTAFSGGEDRETNYQLYRRAQDAISVRNLGTKRGIRFLLLEQFPSISDIEVVGFGDAEMERDLVPYGYTTTITTTQLVSGDQVVTVGSTTATGANYIHAGGKADIYINTLGFSENHLDVVGIVPSIPIVLSSSLPYVVDVPLIRVKDIERLDPTYLTGTGLYIPYAHPIDVRVLRDFSYSRDDYAMERSVGVVRLFFDRPTSCTVNENTVFTSENGQTFTPVQTQTIAASGMRLNTGQNITMTEMDTNIVYNQNIVYYYFDVSVKSDSVGNDDSLLNDGDGLLMTGHTTEGWSISSQDEELAFSTEDVLNLSFTTTYNNGIAVSGESIRIHYEYAPVVEDAQEYVDDDDTRIVTSDLLVKHFQPAYVDMAISYESETATEDAIETAVREFINAIPQGEYFEMSDLINLLYERGADRVQTPIEVLVLILGKDRTYTSERFEDRYATDKRVHFIARNIDVEKL